MHSISRGLAMFYGSLILLNTLTQLLHPHYDANVWWISLRLVAGDASLVVLPLVGVLLLLIGLRPVASPTRKVITAIALTLVLLVSLADIVAFLVLTARSSIEPRFPLPLSLLIAGSLGLMIWTTIRPRQPGSVAVTAATVIGCAAFFPLAQMFCFGYTDYRRPADVIVVFGCRVYSDGRPSQALADRMGTACELYRQGLAPRLIVSGGPGDGAIHETATMKRLAIEAGVPESAITVDEAGVTTHATVLNTSALIQKLGVRRVLAVSHFYHLPRMKMDYQQQGIDVYTVPARESYTLTKMPLFLAREVAAMWAYYLRPVHESTRRP
jgi:vancomycin permeability regulator SanA